MKKLIARCGIIVLSVFLLSWGVTGHRTTGHIAENHLSPQARAAVLRILGTTDLAVVSTWADDVRDQPAYRHTASWHYLQLPLGLSYAAFTQNIQQKGNDNVYAAIVAARKQILSPATSPEKKKEALKFLVHFVGDIHQPMHVARAEDKGGNTIQLNYKGKGTNLHSLWDSGVPQYDGLSDRELAAKYDHTPADSVNKWQQDPLMVWAWESYQISTMLYKEVYGMSNHNITEAYYQKHLPIATKRMQQAGIRLAGMLNEIFKNQPGTGTAPAADMPPPPDIITICDKVYGGKYFSESGTTLLNLGGAYPHQKITIVIKGKVRDQFKDAPETALNGKTICVTGIRELYKGKLQIQLSNANMLQVK